MSGEARDLECGLQHAVIEDIADRRVDDYRNLTDAALRQREEPPAGIFMVEGPGLIEVLLRSAYQVRSLLVTQARFDQLRPALVASDKRCPVFLASNEVVRAVTGFHFHRGALAVALRPPAASWRDIVGGTSLVVVAEHIGDHENLGALFRNAAAFGAGAVLLSPDSVDPLYRRAVRVSMGHVLRVSWAWAEPWPSSLDDLASLGFTVVALTPDRAAAELGEVAQAPGKVAILVGSEESGLTAPARGRADVEARIAMRDGVDSLNVATAAAIALHEFSRRPR